MATDVAQFLPKLGLAILLNGLLLLRLVPWLRRQWHESAQWVRVAFGVGLGLRVGAGLLRNWHLKLDALYINSVGNMLTEQFWASPARFWRLVTQAVTVLPNPNGNYPFVYQISSNTWNLGKILALLNFGSLQCAQVNALYLSLFSFAGCWMLARALLRLFPATPAGAGLVALLFWPSVWFWATGISKEAVLLGSGAWLTARVLAWLYADAAAPDAARRGWTWWAGTVALAVLHVAMRYFFALPLLAVLLGLAIGKALQRLLPQRWAAAVGLALVFAGGALVLPELSVAFRANKFVNQVINIYHFDIAHSVGRLHFEYPNLRPTVASIAAHAPEAVVNTLTQPWLGQSRAPMYLVVGLENALLLLLLALAGWALLRRQGGRLPFAVGLSLSVFCLLLAFLIGITTPNLGSLHRYRSGMLPYLLVLALQNRYAAAALQWLRLGPRPAARPRPIATPNA